MNKETKTQKQLKNFIKNRKYLVWYVKNVENLPVESIVEHTLNYGDWDDVQKLIKIIGINEIAKIFKKQTIGPRFNYRPEVMNYFKQYFNKYAESNA